MAKDLNFLIKKYIAMEDEIKRILNGLRSKEALSSGECSCIKRKTFVTLVDYQYGDLCVVKYCTKCGGWIE
jgi:hypothetical protein